MRPRKALASLLWGALIGAVLGSLVGLAEFAAIFGASEASYVGSLDLAYRHVVYPFVFLGSLLGFLSACFSIVLVYSRRQASHSAVTTRVSTVSILVALTVLSSLSISWVLMHWAPQGSISRSLLAIAVVFAAALAGIGTCFFLISLFSKTRRSSADTISRSLMLDILLAVFVMLVAVVPPLVLGQTFSNAVERIHDDSNRPNVILILVDTLRADHLSVYGYSRETTPNLNELAKTSVTFSQASASSSWTKPSVATIFSALYPVAHKTRSNQDFLSGSVPTLAEGLRDSGYVTLGVTANPLISSTFGFTQGFMDFSSPETVSPFRFTSIGRVTMKISNQLRVAEARDRDAQYSKAPAGKGKTRAEAERTTQGGDRIARFMRSTIRRVTSQIAEVAFGEKVGALPPGDGITDIALTMAERNRDAAPLFLYVHYIDPHVPYSPPPPYDEAFSHHEDAPMRQTGVDARSVGTSIEDRDWIGRSIDLYDGEVLFVDSQIGRLLEGLEGLGLLEDSVVIVTSDHGEEFLDHGGTKHGRTLYEEVLRVPLLLSLPDPSTTGFVYDQPVGLIDLMPTILELAGVDPSQSLQGRSLVRNLVERDDADTSTPYFGQVLRLEMARVGEFKVIRARDQAGSEELYNLKLDPLERDNLVGRSAEQFQELLAVFQELASDTDSLGSQIQQQAVSEDEEALEALRALGYIE